MKRPSPKREGGINNDHILNFNSGVRFYRGNSKFSIEVLELFKAKPDSFDLIITDMTMPHMTGVELIAEVHGVRPELPVILSSGYSEQVNEGNAAEFGIDTYLAKPVESQRLFAELEALLPSDG